MTFLRVKNLEKHQHYKDRRPPWIKLHAEVLEDYAFACLQDASKAHLMLLWVLASRMDNRIPNDPTWIARKINASEPIDIGALVSAGFLEVCDAAGNAVQPASATLAPRKQTAMPETETETETENSLRVAVADAPRLDLADEPARARQAPPREPAVVASEHQGAAVSGRSGATKPGAAAKAEPKYPYYPVEVSNALYAVWTEKKGGYDRARFRRETAVLFDSPTPRYTAEELTGALRLCVVVLEHWATKHRQGYEWSRLTPVSWAGDVVKWVKHYRASIGNAEYVTDLLDAGQRQPARGAA